MARPRKLVDTTDHEIGQAGIVTMSDDGDLERPEIIPVEGPLTDEKKKKMEILAFMDEEVVVLVHPTTDKFEPQYVQLWNDGRHQLIPKGIETPVKRKYVEVLARLKTDSFRNEEYRDAAGNEGVRWPKTTSLRHPFAVVRDPNPKGPAWLKSLLQEAA